MAQVIKALGLKVGGSVYPMLRSHIERLGLDTSHFTGQGWTKGRRNPVNRKPRPLSEILVQNSDCRSTHELRLRLLREGVKSHRCEVCGLTEWNGHMIPLQLDHVNGDRSDNRIENLRILCPNCHAQTDNWCGKNIGRSSKRDTLVAKQASVAELADARASRSRAFGHEGSNPSRGTL